MGDLSPIQRVVRIGRKGADQSDRTIGRNGEQILIHEIVAAAKVASLRRFTPHRSLPDRYLPGGVNGALPHR
jgi:hypothetical protein